MKKYTFFFSVLLLLGCGLLPLHAPAFDPAPGSEVTLELAQRSCDDWGAAENAYCGIVQENGITTRTFQTLKSKYHDETNAYFEAKVRKLSGTSFQADQKRTQTEQETELALIFNERQQEMQKYLAALRTMQFRSGNYSPAAQDSLEAALSEGQTFAAQVATELDLAPRALRLTISAYGEMRTFYALHKGLEALITDLQKLQKTWIDLVSQVARMPSKFLNAAKNFSS